MPPKPKSQLTHFLLLPLVTPTSRPQLQSSLQRFAAEVTAPNDSGEAVLPAKAIRPVGSIHFTIGVMRLLTPERVADACDYLRSLDIHDMLRAASNPPLDDKRASSITTKSKSPVPPSPLSATIPPRFTDALPPLPPIIDDDPQTPLSLPPPQPLFTTLSGLQPHRTSPSRTSSLHAIPTASSPHLHPFATALRAAFTTAGFLVPETRRLKLHATIVNTIYTRRASGSGKKRWGKGSGKFDATGLVARYGNDAVWAADVRVEKVAICEMGARDVREEGDREGEGDGRVVDQVYKEIASVELP